MSKRYKPRDLDENAYVGTRSQRQWLAQNLDPLVEGEWIDDLLYTVKSGKEEIWARTIRLPLWDDRPNDAYPVLRTSGAQHDSSPASGRMRFKRHAYRRTL